MRSVIQKLKDGMLLEISKEEKNWLIEQVERSDRYEKAFKELEFGLEDFGKVTGDNRFVYGVRQVKKNYNL